MDHGHVLIVRTSTSTIPTTTKTFATLVSRAWHVQEAALGVARIVYRPQWPPKDANGGTWSDSTGRSSVFRLSIGDFERRLRLQTSQHVVIIVDGRKANGLQICAVDVRRRPE